MSKKRRIDPSDRSEGLTHNPFAALRPDGAPPLRPEPAAEQRAAPAPAAPSGKLVVRREKKGRGGKTVTRVSGLGLGADGLDDLARRMKRALGSGASVEEDDVLLQGALVERAAAWLEAELGVRVVVGN